MRKPLPPAVLQLTSLWCTRYLDASVWDGVVRALIAYGRGKGLMDRLVQLQLEGKPNPNPPRWLHIIHGTSLENLQRRWSGLPEITMPATQSKPASTEPSTAKTDGMIPIQILLKAQKGSQFASFKPLPPPPDHYWEMLGPSPSKISFKDGEVLDPAQIPLPEEQDGDDLNTLATPDGSDTELEAEDGAAEGAQVIDYAPTTEIDLDREATPAEIAAAKSIQKRWRLGKAKIREREALVVDPFTTAQDETVKLARKLPLANYFYRYILVKYYPYHVLALNAGVLETKKANDRVRDRTSSVNDQGLMFRPAR